MEHHGVRGTSAGQALEQPRSPPHRQALRLISDHFEYRRQSRPLQLHVVRVSHRIPVRLRAHFVVVSAPTRIRRRVTDRFESTHGEHRFIEKIGEKKQQRGEPYRSKSLGLSRPTLYNSATFAAQKKSSTPKLLYASDGRI